VEVSGAEGGVGSGLAVIFFLVGFQSRLALGL